MSPRHPSWPRRQRRRATPCRARIPAPLLPGVIAFFLTRHHSTNALQRAPDVTPGPPALPRARDAGQAHSQHASGVLGPGPKPRRASQERALQGPGSFGPALGLGQCDSDISLRLSIAPLGSGLQKNPLWLLGHGGHTRPPSARSARPSRCAELSPAPPPAGPEALDPPDTPPPPRIDPAHAAALQPARAACVCRRRCERRTDRCLAAWGRQQEPAEAARTQTRTRGGGGDHTLCFGKIGQPRGSPRLGAMKTRGPGGPGAAPCGHDRASGGPRLFQAEQRLSVHKGEEENASVVRTGGRRRSSSWTRLRSHGGDRPGDRPGPLRAGPSGCAAGSRGRTAALQRSLRRKARPAAGEGGGSLCEAANTFSSAVSGLSQPFRGQLVSQNLARN